MQRVLMLDSQGQPLMPCHPARARQLLKSGKAAVFRRVPFMIILKERSGGDTQPVEVKVDPGSQITGMVLVADFQRGKTVIWATELHHRGAAIVKALAQRRAVRRNRRSRHTRYRPARFANRRREAGWLPPSARSRVQNVSTWVARLSRWCPVSDVALEMVKFDPHALQHPEISGVEYQQGTLFGYEVREYLLEKWQRRCAYCGKTGVPLEIEHLLPRSRGGTDRVANLTLACHDCNQRKGTQTAAEFGYPHLLNLAKQSLKDAAAINTIRWALYERLTASTGLPISTGTGGQTKFNRTTQHYPKTHWIDAACVGTSGQLVRLTPAHMPLCIHAAGRQWRQMTLLDSHGFPRTKGKGPRRVHGFRTGDFVTAIVPTGKRQGCYIGKVAVKASGNFTVNGTPDIHWRHCRKLQAADGYMYRQGCVASLSPKHDRQSSPRFVYGA